MASIFWRPLPVMALTIRQFTGGRAVRVVAALSLIPSLFALINVINPEGMESIEFVRDVILTDLFFATLLPITTLILATAALGNEIEDRTLPYLTLKPLSRLRIVVEKWLGCIIVAIPVICSLLLLSMLILLGGSASDYQRTILGALAATAIGIGAYSAVFMLISLVIHRALLLGIIYTFVLETTLGRFLTGFRVVSIRHYVTSIYEQVQDEPALISENAAGLQESIIILTVITVIALLLATWRLRRMSLD